MAKRYYLRFLIRNQVDDLIFEVRKHESERLENRLFDENIHSGSEGFFWFGTVDGRSVAINLTDVQAVRFLWNAASLSPDTIRNEGVISISLRGRAKPLEEYTASPVQLYDFFMSLQHGPDIVSFPLFEDEDGETLQLNAREIVWVIAPTHLLDEGAKSIEEGDGLENGG